MGRIQRTSHFDASDESAPIRHSREAAHRHYAGFSAAFRAERLCGEAVLSTIARTWENRREAK